MSKLDVIRSKIKSRQPAGEGAGQQPRDAFGRWAVGVGSRGIKQSRVIRAIRAHQNPDYSHDKIMQRGAIAMQSLEKGLAQAKTKKQQEAVFKNFKDEIIAQSGVSKAEAKKLLEKTQIDKSIDQEKKWTARQIVSDAAIEFHQLTGGKAAQTLDSFKLIEGNAYALREERMINTGYYVTKPTVMHEMGHHLEFADAGIRQAARTWRDKNAESKTAQKLSKITGNSAFEDDEVAMKMKGKQLSPYVGKIYADDGCTEVISMGLERYASPQSMQSFHEKAPSHFQFIAGILAKAKNL